MTDESGELTYAYPKDTSKNIVVKHLHTEVPLIDLWTPSVITEDVLKTLDETVIRPNFELPSQDKVNDLDEFIETIDDLNNTTTNE